MLAVLVMLLLLLPVPIAAAASTISVNTAAELQAALDASAAGGGPSKISIDAAISLDAAATYSGTRELRLMGPGSLTGTDPTQDVLVTSGNLRLEDLSIFGGRRGVVVVVPEGTRGVVRVRFKDVAVRDTAYHGIQIIDGVVDLAEMGIGPGVAVPDASLPTEALIESEVVGGSGASIMLIADHLTVADSGLGALDQDGLRIDERSDGSIISRLRDSLFVRNGADGVEFDEAGPGDVRVNATDTVIDDNGDFDVEADPDDGFDIDEAGEGNLAVSLKGGSISGNFDEGLDLDEEDAGDVRLRLTELTAADNVDEDVKVTELGDGDIAVRIRGGRYEDAIDASGIALEEFHAGTIRGGIRGATISRNDGSGIELLSLDLSEEAFEDLDDAGAALPRDGAVGLFHVRDVNFSANEDGPVSSFGVEIRGDVAVASFSP